MDDTQQTIAQLTAHFTELAHDLHDKGAINEWKLKAAPTRTPTAFECSSRSCCAAAHFKSS